MGIIYSTYVLVEVYPGEANTAWTDHCSLCPIVLGPGCVGTSPSGDWAEYTPAVTSAIVTPMYTVGLGRWKHNGHSPGSNSPI